VVDVRAKTADEKFFKKSSKKLLTSNKKDVIISSTKQTKQIFHKRKDV